MNTVAYETTIVFRELPPTCLSLNLILFGSQSDPDCNCAICLSIGEIITAATRTKIEISGNTVTEESKKKISMVVTNSFPQVCDKSEGTSELFVQSTMGEGTIVMVLMSCNAFLPYPKV